MSISIATLPPSHAGKRNPMLLEVNTTKYETSAGTLHVLTVTEATPRTAGQTMTLLVGEVSILVTYSAAPDPDLYEVRPYTGVGNYADFLADIQALPLIDKWYVVTGGYVFGASTIVFTQRVPSTTDPIVSVSSWVSTTTGITAPVDPTYAENYRIVCNVYQQMEDAEGRGHVLLARKDAIPDKATLTGRIELQSAFDAILVGEAPQTTTNMGPDRCVDTSTFYWLEIYDRYGTSPVNHAPIMAGHADEYLVATRGGMSWQEWNSSTYLSQWYTDIPNLFMTNRRSKTTREDMPQWLKWYNNTASNAVKLRVVATFSDTTTDSFYSQTGTLDKGLYRYSTGYTQLDMAANVTIPAGERVVSYTCTMVDNATGTTELSEVMAYAVDTLAGPSRYLVYENLLGALETLHCAGDVAYGMEAVAVLGEKVADPAYLKWDAPMRQHYSQGTDTLVWSTGFIYGDDYESLRELALADNVWLLQGNDLLRVVVDKGGLADLYGNVLPPTGLTLKISMANRR